MEVGEDVLDGWEIIEEGYFEEPVDLIGEAERYEGRARKHVTDGVWGVEVAMFA